MPSVNFVLPHWLYWLGLIAFPAIAMLLSRRQRPEPGSRTLGLAYFIWLVGGFLGLHRFYLKNVWGFLFWPLFGIILFSSSMERQARVEITDARAAVEGLEGAVTRTERRITKAEAAIAKAQASLAEIDDPESSTAARLERKIEKERQKVADARAKLDAYAEERKSLTPAIEAAEAKGAQWARNARWAFYAILALMAIDAVLMPSMLARCREKMAANPDDSVTREDLVDDRKLAGTGWPGAIDRLSLFAGEYVAFWSVIAVFVYYYEVLVRYVFNSPTNWAHESMFLMFGMQYLVAGAYAMLTESHVRVDIFYAKFSARGKAIVDLLTSVFFFIFAGTLLVTGWIFARDSIAQGEVSFTEWGIQYWPVKCVIALGAVLLILQGISKVARDVATVISPRGGLSHGA